MRKRRSFVLMFSNAIIYEEKVTVSIIFMDFIIPSMFLSLLY